MRRIRFVSVNIRGQGVRDATDNRRNKSRKQPYNARKRSNQMFS
jgi:hypothetical protein